MAPRLGKAGGGRSGGLRRLQYCVIHSSTLGLQVSRLVRVGVCGLFCGGGCFCGGRVCFEKRFWKTMDRSRGREVFPPCAGVFANGKTHATSRPHAA